MPPQKRPPARRGARLHPPDADPATIRLLAARARRRAAHENSTPAQADAPAVADTPAAADAPAAGDALAAADAPADAGAPAQADVSGRRARPFRVPVVLAVVTVVLGGLAAWFGTEANSLNSPASQNAALINPAATNTVSRQISTAINALFSYDYAFPEPTTQAARRLLTGPAVAQYSNLFGQVQRDAPRQKLIVTTTVTNAGVELLDGSHARVLVFAVESDRHAGGGQPASAGAMLAVNATLQGTTWKISGIDTFSTH